MQIALEMNPKLNVVARSEEAVAVRMSAKESASVLAALAPHPPPRSPGKWGSPSQGTTLPSRSGRKGQMLGVPQSQLLKPPN